MLPTLTLFKTAGEGVGVGKKRPTIFSSLTSGKVGISLPNMTKLTISFELRDYFFGDVMNKNFGVIIFILKHLYFKKAQRHQRRSDMIKVVSIFIKTTFKDSKKVLQTF